MDSTEPDCSYCGAGLLGGHEAFQSGVAHIHPLWPSISMCQACSEQLNLCPCCERRHTRTISWPATEGQIEEPDQPAAFKDPDTHQSVMTDSRSNHLCDSCETVEPVSPEIAQAILQEVLDVLSAVTKGAVSFDELFKFAPPLPVSLEELKELKEKKIRSFSSGILESSPLTYGLCECTTVAINSADDKSSFVGGEEEGRLQKRNATPKQQSVTKCQIYIFKHFSRIVFGAFLCHEVIHAYIYSISSSSLSPSSSSSSLPTCLSSKEQCACEEGLCHYAAFRYISFTLSRIGFCAIAENFPKSKDVPTVKICPSLFGAEIDQAAFWIRKFMCGKHPEFSVGLRKAKILVEVFGWRWVLNDYIARHTL